MRARWVEFFSLLKRAAKKWNADNCLRLGASLSYYTIFSIFPLILVTLSIIQLLLTNSDTARDAILDSLARVTGGFRDEFVQTLSALQQSQSASGIIGVVTLLLGASWVFGELVSAFNIIWGLETPESGGPLHFLRVTLFSFALVLAAAFLLLVAMVISAVLSALGALLTNLPGGALVWTLGSAIINLFVLTLIFALLLKYLPQTYVAWRDVWLGAAITAALWTFLQSAITFYIGLSSYKNYGTIGAVLALVVWVYLSSQVLFLGGEFTAVYAQQYGSRRKMSTESKAAAEQPIERADKPIERTHR